MKTPWTKGLSLDSKNEITLSFHASGLLRERLVLLLKEKITLADKESYSKEGYSSPNWAYAQADTAGYKRALHEIISLIE